MDFQQRCNLSQKEILGLFSICESNINILENVNLEEYSKKLSQNAIFLLGVEGLDVIGFIAYYVNKENSFCYISLFAVSSKCRGTGKGSLLLRELEKNILSIKVISEIRLEVAKNNMNALSFYQKYGFVNLEDRADKLLLQKTIINETSNCLVSIVCLTYNHVNYICQCLNGFLMQKTDFAYEVLIHDDSSTDGTDDIIREYYIKNKSIIRPYYETENQWSKGRLRNVIDLLISESKGKYIAFCEGDDFWSDPEKLQKQVEALEKYPEASMCYTAFQTVDNEGKKYYNEMLERKIKASHSGDMFFEMLKNNVVLTLTTLYRKSVFQKDVYKGSKYSLDYHILLSAAAVGDFLFLPERTACYRQTPTGAMATKSNWVNENCSKIHDYFLIEYIAGRIKKTFSLQAAEAIIELLNRAIRKKLKGDKSDLSSLFKQYPQLWIYYFPTWIQIKIQNWKYQHLH